MTWLQRSSNKFNAKRTTIDGFHFDSKHEGGVYEMAKEALACHAIKGFERQVTFELRGMNGKIVCRHRVDFLIDHLDGSQEVWEAKSAPTATREWAIKRELFIDNYPGIPYTVITSKGAYRKKPRTKRWTMRDVNRRIAGMEIERRPYGK